MKRPPALNKGDQIGLFAPARKISKTEITLAVRMIEKKGYKVVFSEELFASDNQFAGSDKTRSNYLQSLLDDKDIKAVIAVRGGYGSVRIIDQIDFNGFKKSPKWIVGYSDITVFHNHLLQRYRCQSLHASMLLNFDTNTSASVDTLFEVLEGGYPDYTIATNKLNRKGLIRGALCGGNLSVLYSLLGSNSFPDTVNKILFIEDLDEYLYHIDRMMNGFKRAGIFEGLEGMIVGGLTEMNDNEVLFGKTAEEIVRDVIDEYEFPVCFGFPAGHEDHNLPLIMGADVSVSIAEQVKVKFL